MLKSGILTATYVAVFASNALRLVVQPFYGTRNYMFEQHSYAYDVPAEPLREGDLFYRYEIGRWKFNNRIYGIFAGAAVFIFAFFGVLAQTQILTTRGCESPFVGRVCQVLDMAYVGAVLFGTEREMADAEYERTELEAADVVWIDQTGVPAQMEYPEGYFQVANPEQFAQQQAMLNGSSAPYDFNTSGFPPISPPVESGSSLIDTPPIAPKSNPKARPSKLPDSPFDLSDVNGEEDSGDKTATAANTNANTADPKVAQNKPSPGPGEIEDEASSDKNGVYLNKRPLRVKAEETLADVSANKVKLDGNFKVTVAGTLGLAKDGKTVILKDAKPIREPADPKNDPAMEALVQEWILAVGDAGWLGYLELLQGRNKPKSKRVVITVEQNDEKFTAIIKSEVGSENEANTLATALRNMITFGGMGAKPDELTFLKAASTTSEKNQLILNVNLAKPIVQELIQRKLAEQAAELKTPSGNAATPQSNNTALK
ncbi:MAG: hypothetical protein PSX80_10935 [bacterium]|nr:hypothetical protein [bacterium]